MATNTFLTKRELTELTGIGIGKLDKPLHQRQSEALQAMGIPHYINAVNRVIVARAVIENGIKVDARAAFRSGMNIAAIQ